MCIEFEELQPEDAVWAAPILSQSGQMGCEFSYTTAYMWSRFYDVRIARVNDAVILCSGYTESPSFLLPIGMPIADGIALLREYANSRGVALRLHGVTEEIREQLRVIYADQVQFELHDEDFDYLYETQALATLPGNTYHSKKNHISAFTRKYNWRYEPISAQNVETVVALSAEWCHEKGECVDAGLSSERCAIRRLLKHREQLSVSGGLVYVDEKAVAFTLGSPINDDVFDVHVEKALGDYAGAYAVINREFAKTLTAYRYLNRENDMGIPGLRRAKESYRPAILLKKYTCEFV
jgi:hypothetical protein